MKLIESKVEYIPQDWTLEGIYKHIELCSRTCYKSEDNFEEGNSKAFVDKLIKKGHTAMLEHGTVYLRIPNLGVAGAPGDCMRSWYRYKYNKYSKCTEIPSHDVYELCVTTNLRVLYENDGLTDLQYLVKPTESHEKRYTIKFTCSRAISHELVRHRVFSFAQESQRYINYSKERHGGEITFIIPQYLSELKEGRYINNDGDWYSDTEYADPTDIIMKDSETHNKWNSMLHCFSMAEQEYQYLLKIGATPQQARDVLPNATKTELIMTGFASDWRHFFDLRLFGKTGKSHPDMINLAEKAKKVLEEKGLWEGIMKQQ